MHYIETCCKLQFSVKAVLVKGMILNFFGACASYDVSPFISIVNETNKNKYITPAENLALKISRLVEKTC